VDLIEIPCGGTEVVDPIHISHVGEADGVGEAGADVGGEWTSLPTGSRGESPPTYECRMELSSDPNAPLASVLRSISLTDIPPPFDAFGVSTGWYLPPEGCT